MPEIITKKTLVPIGLVLGIATLVIGIALYIAGIGNIAVQAQDIAEENKNTTVELMKEFKVYNERITRMETLLETIRDDVKTIKDKI